MRLFNYFFDRKKDRNTATLAKDRLQLVVAHQRVEREQPDYLPALQKEILEVIRKYVVIDDEELLVQLSNEDGCSVIELNVPLTAEKVVKAKEKSESNKGSNKTTKNKAKSKDATSDNSSTKVESAKKAQTQ